jgi:hypothetical protein
MSRCRLKRAFVLGCVLALAALLGGVLAAGTRLGDYDDNGIVDTSDMFDFARYYRERKDPHAARPADLNHDGKIDEFDIFLFLREWNTDRDKVYQSL